MRSQRSGVFNAPGLRAKRMLAGLTCATLARRVRISNGYISLLERGERKALPPTASKIAKALGLTLTQAVDQGVFRRASGNGRLSHPRSRVRRGRGETR